MSDSTDTGLRFFYFDVAHAISVHDWIIEHSGGLGYWSIRKPLRAHTKRRGLSTNGGQAESLSFSLTKTMPLMMVINAHP
ncbi:MAG: hypothetical protein P1P78_14460 [Methyloprofundus sp.]|nr:hypothetical protein [Methyloprofundus sp.]